MTPRAIDIFFAIIGPGCFLVCIWLIHRVNERICLHNERHPERWTQERLCDRVTRLEEKCENIQRRG